MEGLEMIGDTDDFLKEVLSLDAREGLPEQLFIAISAIMPIANVDLFVQNEKNEILLSWRDDEYYGKGWHLPGGCMRYKETMLERVQKTAICELGTSVIVKPEPIAVRDAILGKDSEFPRLRAHHIAVMFECKLPDGYYIYNSNKVETSPGFLKWFNKIPENILSIHNVYFDVFKSYNLIF